MEYQPNDHYRKSSEVCERKLKKGAKVKKARIYNKIKIPTVYFDLSLTVLENFDEVTCIN